jgi:hypothetical protein
MDGDERAQTCVHGAREWRAAKAHRKPSLDVHDEAP